MELAERIAYLKEYDGEQITIMEVCGSHTASIAKNGIRTMLSDKIRLVSGPGCPVCVTPSAYIDKLISMALEEHVTIVSFGDLLRVPGSEKSLAQAKGEGARVEMVYGPFDTLELAKKEPQTQFVFAAVGFETTTPVYALLAEQLLKENIKNVRLLTALKTMPPVLRYLCENEAPVDAFLAPGHVCTVTGYRDYDDLAAEFQKPFGVAGFSAEEILEALYGIIKMKNIGKNRAYNFYPSVVTKEGNEKAKQLIERYFEPADAYWRGMGMIAGSGRRLKDAYQFLDAGSDGLTEDKKKNAGCSCDKVLLGKIEPRECPLFGKICNPMHPQGACMVSSEGACFSMMQE